MADITWALKEWGVAVKALLSGDLVLLVRKGGIHEAKPVFNVPSDRVLLFPTYEHQSAEQMRKPWRSQVSAKTVPPVGDPMQLLGWAEITHTLELTSPESVSRLHPFHIWTDEWLSDRLAWKPERPAFVLLLRSHCFAEPVALTYEQRYGGCRSWLELAELSALPDSLPVLTDKQYQQRIAAIEAAIAPITSASASRG